MWINSVDLPVLTCPPFWVGDSLTNLSTDVCRKPRQQKLFYFATLAIPLQAKCQLSPDGNGKNRHSIGRTRPCVARWPRCAGCSANSTIQRAGRPADCASIPQLQNVLYATQKATSCANSQPNPLTELHSYSFAELIAGVLLLALRREQTL